MCSSARSVTGLCLAVFFISNLFSQTQWTENTFEDFIDGSFLDAGSNLYVSAKGRMQMITRWDFNDDGNPDILICAGHAHTEKENTYIYLNNGGDIDGRSRIDIPGGGSRDGVIADFNKDGWNDIAVVSYHDSHYGRMDIWIYYGGPEGYYVKKRSTVPAYEATSLAAGDFNGDGWIDLAPGCQWQAGEDKPYGPKMSFVYWNAEEGFSRDHRTEFSFDGRGADYVAAGDLDTDGVDDLVAMASGQMHIFYSSRDAFNDPDKRVTLPVAGNSVAIGNINHDEYPEVAVCAPEAVIVLIGGENGFHIEKKIVIPVDKPADVVFADCDGNGYDDVVVANFSTPDGATWTDSFVFYADKGQISTNNPQRLPTLGATGVSAGDLNGDGFPEIVFSNQYVTNQNNIASYVYWNTGGRYLDAHRTQLPTEGSWANSIGDVNMDGLPDVVFYNDEGGFRDGPSTSHIYWGDGTRNFSMNRSTSLLTHQVFGLGHADLDDDGHVDIVLARSGFIRGVNHAQNGLIMHWGSPEGFNVTSQLTMKTAYGGMRIADINRDGWLDMMAGGAVTDLDDPSKHGFPIFWGSATGFKNTNRTLLHIERSGIRGPLLMDLNRDGWLDIAGQEVDGQVKIWWGSSQGFTDSGFTLIDLERSDQLLYIKGADFNKDGWLDLLCPQRGPSEGIEVTSFLYYGSRNGFSNDRRIELPSYVPYQNTIAEFDKDGWLDIFLCSYGGEISGNRPSLIYWGGPDGFLKRPRLELETYGSSGSEAVDYDGDGWLDLLIANHRKSGLWHEAKPHRHLCNSMLYWGGPESFSDEKRWEVEAEGPSGLNLRDLGNSYDRGLYEDYISSAYQIPKGEKPISIEWKADTPHGTSVRFQLRSAKSEGKLASAEWTGPNGPESWYEANGSKIRLKKGNIIQYRARLETPNGSATPYLTSVTVQFQ